MDHTSIGESDWVTLQSNLEATILATESIDLQRLGKIKDEKNGATRLPEQGKILEIGCGPGSFAENLKEDLMPRPYTCYAICCRTKSKRKTTF